MIEALLHCIRVKLTNKKKKQINTILLKIPSLIFSTPVVTTVCTIVIARFTPYWGLILSSIFFYILMPVLAYAYLYKKGLITDKKFDFNVRKREERPLYNFIMILGFLTNYILISMYKIPIVEEIALFLLISFLVFTIVTLFWKISGHMTQTVLAILTLAYIFPNARLWILLVGYLICIPLVGLSRIKLKHHNIWQVVAGTLVTTIIGVLLFTIF
jgi:membrane-associated phospholipid phosphatase